MKRSEMVNIISNKLQKNHKWFLKHLDPKTISDNLAFTILSEIEKAGMLPPEVDPIPQNIIDNCESANYWEPEDD